MPIIVDILTQQFHLSSIDTISKYLGIYSTIMVKGYFCITVQNWF